MDKKVKKIEIVLEEIYDMIAGKYRKKGSVYWSEYKKQLNKFPHA